MSKRSVGILLLLAIVGFYAVGTGFNFFYRFFYALILLQLLGFVWAWAGLRGIDLELIRTATRGQVGGYMEGRVRLRNRLRLPKSWLEVVEFTDLPDPSPGRGLAVVGDQIRTWKTDTYLSRRGVYVTGQIDIFSHDPFGLFRLRRRFLTPQTYTVLPATHPLPDVDPALANLPSDGRSMRHWEHITTDVASIRQYSDGDSYRRIHWPYTARMNSLMVKEFDLGLSAENWVVLDMDAEVHVGASLDLVENTEEAAVTVAASLINRMADFSIPTGLAVSSGQRVIHRPNTSPEHPGRLLEMLAIVKPSGNTSLERFLYELRPFFSRFNTLTVITPSCDLEWAPALQNLRRGGVSVSVVLIDPQEYGGSTSVDAVVQSLTAYELPSYVVKRGQSLNDALRTSTGRWPTKGAAAIYPAARLAGGRGG